MQVDDVSLDSLNCQYCDGFWLKCPRLSEISHNPIYLLELNEKDYLDGIRDVLKKRTYLHLVKMFIDLISRFQFTGYSNLFGSTSL